MGLVTQNSILGLGDAGGAHFKFTLRVIVLVNALVHIGTGVIDAVVVVDNSKFFSTLPRLLLRHRSSHVALTGVDVPSNGGVTN